MRRITAALAAILLLLCCAARAELPWPADSTEGQRALRAYIDAVNAILREHGEPAVNSLFECWPTLAVLGVTGEDNAEIPETVEITVNLNAEDMDSLELRVSDPVRFAPLCAALIQAVPGSGLSWEDALKGPGAYVRQAGENPDNSISETVYPERGTSPRAYYAYAPNQHRDKVNWLSMTLIFPRAGEADAIRVTPVPELNDEKRPLSSDDRDAEWVGYNPEPDDAEHFEVFVTETPEPDSAVYPY